MGYGPASDGRGRRGTWRATGSLVTGRYGHTATRLLNGKILVAGGIGALTGAELYDPATGTWSATGSLTYGRSNHTATLLNNGKVLVAGGGPLQCELYDPAGTGSWTTASSLSHRPRVSHRHPPERRPRPGGGGY